MIKLMVMLMYTFGSAEGSGDIKSCSCVVCYVADGDSLAFVSSVCWCQ